MVAGEGAAGTKALKLEVLSKCGTSRARRSKLSLPHFTCDTPMFMPVGTCAAVKVMKHRHVYQPCNARLLAVMIGIGGFSGRILEWKPHAVDGESAMPVSGACVHAPSYPRDAMPTLHPSDLRMTFTAQIDSQGMSTEELEALDCHLILANTYHLALQPGTDLVQVEYSSASQASPLTHHAKCLSPDDAPFPRRRRSGGSTRL